MSAWYQDFSNNLFRAIYKSHFYQTKWNPSRSILLFLIKDIMLDATLNFYPKSIVFLLGGGGRVKRCFGMVLVHKTFWSHECLVWTIVFAFIEQLIYEYGLIYVHLKYIIDGRLPISYIAASWLCLTTFN